MQSEQPVQTRFQIAGVPGTGRALPRERPRLRGLGGTGEPGGWAEHACARHGLAYGPLAPWEQSRPSLAASPAGFVTLDLIQRLQFKPPESWGLELHVQD